MTPIPRSPFEDANERFALSVRILLGIIGGGGGDGASSMVLNSHKNVYVAGDTSSLDFPTTDGAFDTSCGTDENCNGTDDAFVSKFDSNF